MPTTQPGSEAAPAGVKNNRQNVRKKRTAVSCDRCKNRKTKCIDPVPGPCHYCASINAPCKTDLNRRKKRPYYHVSEEEYRCMTTILRHYLPEVEFNLPSLKALCQRLEGLSAAGDDDENDDDDFSARPSPMPIPMPTTTATRDGEEVFGPDDPRHHGDGTMATPLNNPSSSPEEQTAGGKEEEEEEKAGMQEIQELQEHLGCLMIDSRGNYRHVGTDSSIGFNAAIRMIKGNNHHHHHNGMHEDQTEADHPKNNALPENIIIQPLTTTSLPPATPESSVGGTEYSYSCPSSSSPPSSCSGAHNAGVYLPRLEQASASIQRYFDEVHCLYWLFSTEQFHERVHETYMTGGILAGASWMCCLYSIFAIGGSGGGGSGVEGAGQQQGAQQKTSAEYLVMAKALVPQVVDEADVDSVRALTLLALALQTECYTNAAYLYIGTAVRTAYSLGLHVEKAAPPTRGRLEREQNRRIWWTLYLLDYEMAHRYGNPCAVIDEMQDVQVQMPSEQILSPGPNTPLGFLAASSTLCAISRHIRTALHNHHHQKAPAATTTTTTSQPPPKAPNSTSLPTLLTTLHAWHASLPPHLSAAALPLHTPPAHRRALAVLHARYWAAVVLATRPFLLSTALGALGRGAGGRRRRRHCMRRWRRRERERERERGEGWAGGDEWREGEGEGRRTDEEEVEMEMEMDLGHCSSSSSSAAAAAGRCACRRRSGGGDGLHDDEDAGMASSSVAEKRQQQWRRRGFAEEMSATCVGAARRGLDVMRTMVNKSGGGDAGGGTGSSSLSSLVNFDCSNLLELVQVFRLAMVLDEEEDEDDEEEQEGEEKEMEETTSAAPRELSSSSNFSHDKSCCCGVEEGGGASRTSARTGATKIKEMWTQRIHEAVEIMHAMEPVGWTARALPELSAQLRECGILDGEDWRGGGNGGCDDAELAPPLGMEDMIRDAMTGQPSAGFGGVEGMEADDSLGTLFFGDVLGDPTAAFGDTMDNNILFLDIDFA
ncbi:aldehyde dehydrogenase [Diplodia corticola]|uniref:Aldehyde dehydrogenase n=1 Tax=Diplodia corticola TaxID=236234 RepID=A0A1J9QR61_9PEZI|nr:aldehyde dehydrogenase [Diplodia corticola]OJD31430.1 aldehyde dehydrogenase [Diplodia corticola]